MALCQESISKINLHPVADSISDVKGEMKLSRAKKGMDFDVMDKQMVIEMIKEEMLVAADKMEFERAAKLRDEISALEKEVIKVSPA